MSNLTVLIPTSPIPSHPSTAILDETISNIRKYTDAKIIIMADGVHKSLEHRKADYDAYLVTVENRISVGAYGDCQLNWFPQHVHQSMMTQYVLKSMVTTPLIMFCEHDTSPIGDIPFKEICECVKISDHINYVRFNIFEQIPNEHQYLMIGKSEYYYQEIVDGVDGPEIWLTRTIQWSQRPHIAKTQWYLSLLERYFTDNRYSMIEDVMHSVVQVEYEKNGNVDKFGLAIYTPEGNQLRSYHADGRGSDEKIITG
jgi:hypothetical protein